MVSESPFRLVLHIGAHKTGTTALQSFFKKSQDQLHEQGWVFGRSPEAAINWNPLVGVAAGSGRFVLDETIFAAMQRRIASRKRHMIISAEDLFFLEAAEVTRFAAGVLPLVSDLTIVAYLRRQDQMAISHWAQGGKTVKSAAMFGWGAGQLRPLTDQMASYLDYAGRMETWQRAFPDARVIPRIYDRSRFAGGDIVKDFLQLMNLTIERAKDPPEVNESLGTDTVQFMYWLRELGFDRQEVQQIFLRKMIELHGEKALPSRAEAESFVAPFSDSNRRLVQRFGEDLAFGQDYSDYPEQSSFRKVTDDFKLRNIAAVALALRAGLKKDG